MKYENLILLFITIINATIGLFVFLKRGRNPERAIFSIYVLGLSAWTFGVYVLKIANNSKLIASHIAVSGAALMATGFLLFSIKFTEKKENKLLTYLICLPFIIFSLAFRQVVSDVKIYPVGFKVEYGILRLFYIIYIWLFFGCGLNILFQSFRKERGLKKIQIGYIFLGTFISALLASITNIILPILGNSKYSAIGPLFTLPFTAFTAYAILKHQLMEIEVIIKKSIVYSTLVSAVAITYVMLALLLGQYLRNITGFGNVIIIILTAIIIVAGYRPLEGFLERITDKIFFKGKYDYRKALKELSREICTVMDLRQLLDLIVERLTRVVKIKRVSIFVRSNNLWVGLKSEYFKDGYQTSEIETEIDEEFGKYLGQHSEIICSETTDERLKRFCDEHEAVIFIPIIGKAGLTGILNIGEKLSEDPYTREDLELFSVLSNHASIAIENAKLLEKEKEMQKELDRAERLSALGRFASGIVHEIRNPLVSIKAFFQMFKDKSESEEDKNALSEIAFQEIIRVESLLENMLNFARSPSPRRLYEDIAELLNETVSLVKPEASMRKIKIIINKEDEKLPRILIDAKQLKQVFLNLIYNAMQAMPDGGRLDVEIAQNNSENNLILKFNDNGVGIGREEIEKIFDPFYSTKPGGTGLGLAVSCSIIKNHGGEINVSSEPGKGTTFEIRLPIKA